jgi:hypothetical protein
MPSIRYHLMRAQGFGGVTAAWLTLALLAPATALADDTRARRNYLESLCRQAGLPVSPAGRACEGLRGARAWTVVVQAGLNDIDRRCDAYLAWVDERKRLGRVTEDLDAAVPLRAMAAAAAALGIEQRVFARRIGSASATALIQAAVQRQQRYRASLPSTISGRLAAIEVMRRYLLICAPAAIEAELRKSKS